MTTLVVLIGLLALACEGARLPWPWVAKPIRDTTFTLSNTLASAPSGQNPTGESAGFPEIPGLTANMAGSKCQILSTRTPFEANRGRPGFAAQAKRARCPRPNG